MQNWLLKKNSCVALLALIVLVASIHIIVVSGNPGVAKLTAPRIEDTTLTSGSTFSINVNVSDVSDLWGFEFRLYFDPTVLNASGYDFYSPFTDPSPSEINNTAGRVALACSMPFGTASGEGFSTVEPKPIAKIDFLVKGIGVSVLDLRDTLLVTPDAQVIEHKLVDGHFSNIAAKASVSPQITHEKMGGTFHINITLSKVEKVYGYYFLLSYNTTILNATAYVSYDPFTIELLSSINDTAGYVIMNYSMPTTDGFNAVDPVPIAGIDFAVDEIGQSLLDLQNAAITDIDGKILDIQTISGEFSNVRDVAVVEVKALQSLVSPGQLVYINVTVADYGDSDETFNLMTTYSNASVENTFTTVSVSLEAGEIRVIPLTWNTEGISESTYRLQAEAVLDGDIKLDNNITSGLTTVRVRGPPLGDVLDLYLLAIGVFGAFGAVGAFSAFKARKRRQRMTFVKSFL